MDIGEEIEVIEITPIEVPAEQPRELPVEEPVEEPVLVPDRDRELVPA